MELAPVAQAAVAILLPLLTKAFDSAAQKVGQETRERVEAVYRAIREKFTQDDDDYAKTTLDRLGEEPANERRQAALEDLLVEKSKTDPAFAKQLADLVKDAAQHEETNQFVTQVSGNAKVGHITNVGNAGIVDIE